MNDKPKVLIFDDEIDWAKAIEIDIRDRYDATIVTTPEEWNAKIAPSYWNVIIVDAQILGSAKMGFEIAEDAILTLGIKSPIIVITNKVDIENIRREKGSLFFEYISKARPDFSEKLLTEIDRAYASTRNREHVCKILREIAREENILNAELSNGLVEIWKSELRIFGKSLTSDKITFNGLIELMRDGNVEEYHKDRIEILLWDIIRDSRESRYR